MTMELDPPSFVIEYNDGHHDYPFESWSRDSGSGLLLIARCDGKDDAQYVLHALAMHEQQNEERRRSHDLVQAAKKRRDEMQGLLRAAAEELVAANDRAAALQVKLQVAVEALSGLVTVAEGRWGPTQSFTGTRWEQPIALAREALAQIKAG